MSLVKSKTYSGKTPASPASPCFSLPGWATSAPVVEVEPEPVEAAAVPTVTAPLVDHWDDIDEDAYAYLTGPRNYPAPCIWCGGRLVHSKHCDDLRLSYEPAMPWGRHKGARLSDLPISYLHHLKTTARGDDELQAHVIAEWNRRKN